MKISVFLSMIFLSLNIYSADIIMTPGESRWIGYDLVMCEDNRQFDCHQEFKDMKSQYEICKRVRNSGICFAQIFEVESVPSHCRGWVAFCAENCPRDSGVCYAMCNGEIK